MKPIRTSVRLNQEIIVNKVQKRQQKQKKREREKKAAFLRDKGLKIRRQKLDEYPSFVLGRQDADPEFIAAIQMAVRQFDFLDTKKLGLGLQSFFKLGKEAGFAEAFKVLEQVPSINYCGQQLSGDVKLLAVLTYLGSRILHSVPKEIRRKYMPFNDVAIEPFQREIRLNFSSMDSTSGAGGRIFFGRHRPKIAFEGNDYTVAFSRHAIERICQRLNPRYMEYAAAGDVHAIFSTCVYFEPIMLYGDRPAFALFAVCGDKGFRQYQTYTVGVFGEENIKPFCGELYYRIGYCPVVFENSFAKAKTFLPPGFRGTPEYGLALNSEMRPIEKREFLERISVDSGDANEGCLSHEATKWFHDNGLPQVFQWSHEVFRL
jgi:hypothetical protein